MSWIQFLEVKFQIRRLPVVEPVARFIASGSSDIDVTAS